MRTFRPRASAAPVHLAERSDSTNTQLREAVRADPGGWPHGSGLATLHQTAGRGRLGRSWQADPGHCLALSVLLRRGVPVTAEGAEAAVPAEALGWVPLIAGEAVQRTVQGLIAPEHRAGVKWPNDVLIDGRKCSGILSELTPDGDVIVGVGLNLTLPADRLPVPTATSLLLAGLPERWRAADGTAGDELIEHVIDGVVGGLLHGYRLLALGRVDEVRGPVESACTTIGAEVTASLPDGGALNGTAVGLDAAGRLRIRRADGEVQAVAAADIVHVR